jgi:hypothetical protein
MGPAGQAAAGQEFDERRAAKAGNDAKASHLAKGRTQFSKEHRKN